MCRTHLGHGKYRDIHTDMSTTLTPQRTRNGTLPSSLDCKRDRACAAVPHHHPQIIPGARAMGYKIQAHAFQGYWEDIGTIEAFYNANLALAKPGKTDFRWGGVCACFVCVCVCMCCGGC